MDLGSKDESYLKVGDIEGHDYEIDKGIIPNEETGDTYLEWVFRYLCQIGVVLDEEPDYLFIEKTILTPCDNCEMNSSDFGVSWYDQRDGNGEIYFAQISAGGTEIGSDVRVTSDAATSQMSSLAWTGTEFGVSWEDRRDGNSEIYFARIVSGACP